MVRVREAILAEFATEDLSRMTRHVLMKWIEKKNKKMSASRVYNEFDQMFNRLPTADQVLLEEDKSLYFLKAVDMKDRRELGTLLEDDTQANGLVVDWVAVKRACNRLDKRCQWVDDTNLAGPSTEKIWLMLLHTLRGQYEAIHGEPDVLFRKQQHFRESWKKAEVFSYFGDRMKWRYAPPKLLFLPLS